MLVGERILGPIHTNRFFSKNGDFFPPVWPTVHSYPVKTVTENAPFQKKLARIEIFENAGFSFACVRMNTGDFEYDDVIHQKYII